MSAGRGAANGMGVCPVSAPGGPRGRRVYAPGRPGPRLSGARVRLVCQRAPPPACPGPPSASDAPRGLTVSIRVRVPGIPRLQFPRPLGSLPLLPAFPFRFCPSTQPPSPRVLRAGLGSAPSSRGLGLWNPRLTARNLRSSVR